VIPHARAVPVCEGKPMLELVSDEELAQRRHRRAPRTN
jgi:hypothetical protein